MRTIILHHKDCSDGFGAAFWLQRCLGVECELVPMEWHAAPPIARMEGAHVWSVDYCPDGEWLYRINQIAASFTVLDHHQSSLAEPPKAGLGIIGNIGAFCDLAELGGLDRTTIVIDQDHSGAGLVAIAMRREMGKIAPRFLANIEDRDLWRFLLWDTKDVTAAVNARPYTIEAWDELAMTEHAQLVAEGRAINLYRETLIEAVAASTFRIRIGDFYVPCATSPYMIGSDVAGLLAERSPNGIGAYAILHAADVQIGLRSRNDGPDVAKLAESCGGGGHRNASGLRMTWQEFFAARSYSALTEI